MTALSELPYRHGPMAGRHWGHARHELCSFPSKIKPAIASVLVSLFSSPGSTVLDPFSGCGTIPFEAALQGRVSVASDLSPLSFVITSAKVDPPTDGELATTLEQLNVAIEQLASSDLLDEMEDEIRAFYHERTALEIVAARGFLRELTAGFSTDRAGLFIAACLAHVLHGNRPYALSRRSHNIIPIPPRGPFQYKPVYEAVAAKVKRMLRFPLTDGFQRGKAYLASADGLPLADRTIDVVLTSPPFLGTTEFLRQNRLRNWLVGWSYSRQSRERESFLEHDNRVERYAPIVQELARLCRPGAVLVFHLGVIKGNNMVSSLVPVFEKYGFRFVDTIWEDTRHLETHGRTDRGATHTHGFLVLTK